MIHDLLSNLLVFLASVLFLISVYFSFKLSKETKNERYWLLLAVGFFIFATHHWLMIPFVGGFISEDVVFFAEQITSIIGAILIAYSTYGLYSSMKIINERLK